MIEKLRSMAIFATVVDKGSFRAAGRQLGLSPSRISETVSDLEQQLGVTLMYRSTRRMSLTHEGHVLYAEA
ncbi:MAG: LysR family transcriptional regulator [Myxococcota bacterium]